MDVRFYRVTVEWDVIEFVGDHPVEQFFRVVINEQIYFVRENEFLVQLFMNKGKFIQKLSPKFFVYFWNLHLIEQIIQRIFSVILLAVFPFHWLLLEDQPFSP